MICCKHESRNNIYSGKKNEKGKSDSESPMLNVKRGLYVIWGMIAVVKCNWTKERFVNDCSINV